MVAHYLLWGLGFEIINTVLCLVPDLNNDNNHHTFSARGGVLAVHKRSPREADNFRLAYVEKLVSGLLLVWLEPC